MSGDEVSILSYFLHSKLGNSVMNLFLLQVVKKNHKNSMPCDYWLIWNPDCSLAFCEIFLAVAALTLRVIPHMQLYETTIDDIKYDHDLGIPKPKTGSMGVRVIIN
jgi:hypothetical protein